MGPPNIANIETHFVQPGSCSPSGCQRRLVSILWCYSGSNRHRVDVQMLFTRKRSGVPNVQNVASCDHGPECADGTDSCNQRARWPRSFVKHGITMEQRLAQFSVLQVPTCG